MLHPGFDEREPIEHRSQMSRRLMLQSDQICTKLTDGRVEFADLHATSAYVSLQVLDIGLNLIDILGQAVDVAAKENGLIAVLADAGLELRNPGLQLVEIGLQCHHVQVDTVGDGPVGLEFAANVFVFAVASVHVAILCQHAGAQLEQAGVQKGQAVVDMR